jgi:hypothetical protein
MNPKAWALAAFAAGACLVACDLNPQPLPPGEQPPLGDYDATHPTSGTATSSGYGATSGTASGGGFTGTASSSGTGGSSSGGITSGASSGQSGEDATANDTGGDGGNEPGLNDAESDVSDATPTEAGDVSEDAPEDATVDGPSE